jgi:hypothetical protein
MDVNCHLARVNNLAIVFGKNRARFAERTLFKQSLDKWASKPVFRFFFL